MLIKFSFDNWLSFRNPVTLSMVAGRERQHNARVPRIDKYPVRVLPVAAIYGGNASGKTNLFKALNFARNFVVTGVKPKSRIPVEPYCLDSQSGDLSSSFSLELLIQENIYELSFSVSTKEVIEEKLVHISSASEQVLYDRKRGKIKFHESLVADQALQFAFKGTQDNQLFLSNSVSQKLPNFALIHDWFKDTLELVAPDSRFGAFDQFLDDQHLIHETMNTMLAQLDTGITHLGGDEISIELLDIPEEIRTDIQQEVTEGTAIRLIYENQSILFSRKDGRLVAKKLVSFHSKDDGSDVKFEIGQESDGSRRIIDLLPAFLAVAAAESSKVFVIDEVDRSLHTLLTRRLFEQYLASCSTASRSQILFTTHDLLLMDQDLFRRDEMWVTERDRIGASSLISFNDYKDIRYDKDIRKSYLQGRMGGIPRLVVGDFPSYLDTSQRGK